MEIESEENVMSQIIQDMSNAMIEHSIIINNFVTCVNKSLKNSVCRVFGEGIQFQWDCVGDKKYTPDAFIICSFRKRTNTTLHEVPRMVMEVLSPSTEGIDRNEKLSAYNLAGVGEVWLVDWRKRTVEIYVFDDDGSGITTKPYLYEKVTEQNKQELKLVNFPITPIDFDELFDLSVLEM